MQFLSLESSTDVASVALWRDGQISERHCPPGQASSATLLPLAAELLAEAGCHFAELDAIAFGSGPGSFTGLRVACGAAQGLAMGHGLPVLPVGTLEAMAASVAEPRVLVCLDARMNEVYSACFINAQAVSPISVSPPGALLLPEGEAWVALGNALTAYPELAARLRAPRIKALLPEVMPGAAAIARLAAPRLLRGEGIDPADAAPLYVRDKVAQTVAERLAQGGRA